MDNIKTVKTTGGNITTDNGRLVSAWCKNCNRDGWSRRCSCGNEIATAAEVEGAGGKEQDDA